ncbi:unnamed protein product [Rhodiola kirilowii]
MSSSGSILSNSSSAPEFRIRAPQSQWLKRDGRYRQRGLRFRKAWVIFFGDLDLANGGDDVLSPKYALVVLNQSIPRFTPLLWQHAEIRLCADGGFMHRMC